MNETIELEHDIEGLEEIPSLPHENLEALNRESKGFKPNMLGLDTEIIVHRIPVKLRFPPVQ